MSDEETKTDCTNMASEPHIRRGAIVHTAKWTIEMNRYEDGSSSMNRINDGFSIFEMMGIVEFLKHDILDQYVGVTKPDEVTRSWVKP